MCGIFYYKGKKYTVSEIKEWMMKTVHRGPDITKSEKINEHFLGFHRLRINGVDEASDQPMFLDEDLALVCNGEIYNFQELAKENDFVLNTRSDCEIVLHLYRKYGEKFCDMLYGVFSFVLYDIKADKIMVSRDPIGIRSLYWVPNAMEGPEQVIASEMKSIPTELDAEQFPPGHYWYDGKLVQWYFHDYTIRENESTDEIAKNCRELLEREINLRLLSDRPIGCILSGGLDSTAVTSIVNQKIKNLNTYTIGLEGATDLHYAKMAAKHFGTVHHECIVTEEQFLAAIPETIYQIESWDTTTVRASTGNYLVAQFIRSCNNGDVVIFCGDVADELFGSYRGFCLAPNAQRFQNENVKMLENIHHYDVLRSDRTISSAGLEARVPFGGKDFMKYVMELDPKHKVFDKVKIEKYFLRKGFEDLLPEELCWRRKEAFSDGVSKLERSWLDIIKEFVDKIYTDEQFEELSQKYDVNRPYDKESLYYRELFNKYYPGRDHVIPYYWKHPFTQQQDPSARKLDCY